jgi:hypothetical protein
MRLDARRYPCGPCKRRRGVILLLVAWCVLILGLLLANRIRREEMAFTEDRTADIDMNLEFCVRSAEGMVLAGLAADANGGKEASYDAPSDGWGWTRLKEKYGQDLEKSYPDIVLSVAIEDEGGKINPLKSPPEVLARLLRNMGYSEAQARELAELIQKACKAPEPASMEKAGNEGGNGDGPQFIDLRKLLAIPALTEELLYSEDANFNNQLDANENDGGESSPPDDRNGQLRIGLLDFLAARGDGKVNPNMAPMEILLTVPGMSKKIATEIVNCRSGSDGIAGTEDDHVFKSVEEIKKLSSVSKYVEFEYEKMVPYLRMSTDTFQVKICASSKRTGQILRRQSVIRRKKDKLTILSQCEDNGV